MVADVAAVSAAGAGGKSPDGLGGFLGNDFTLSQSIDCAVARAVISWDDGGWHTSALAASPVGSPAAAALPASNRRLH